MKISAQLVKELRERTGAGMMECKKALTETGGDLETAAENLRKSGAAKADKKANRVAAEGVIAIETADGGRGVMLEVNCETDFVSGGDEFRNFATELAQLALAGGIDSVEALLAADLKDGRTVDAARRDLIAKIGENVSVRRLGVSAGGDRVGAYVHSNRKIGVLVAMSGGNDELARDVSMHVAATNPACISSDNVPAERIDKERKFLIEQAREEGKPDNIVEKMVEGRLRKFLKEITLLGQPFVRDPDMTVEKLLAQSEASVDSFLRFEVGEGIEKKQEDFAAEVMAQVRGE